MSKIIIISSDHHLVSEIKNLATKKACQVTHYNEQEWKNKQVQFENSNVINIKDVILPTGKISVKALKPLGEVQMDTIRQALYSMNGNVSRVSKALNIGRATLYRKIKDHDIDLTDIRNPKKPPVKLPMAS